MCCEQKELVGGLRGFYLTRILSSGVFFFFRENNCGWTSTTILIVDDSFSMGEVDEGPMKER